MPEYIERESLLKKAKELAQNFSSSCLATPHIIKAIENAPKADVVEVKHSEWKWGKVCGQEGIYCTNCQAGWVDSVNAEWIAHEHDYCPKCGAKMDQKEGAEE